MNTLGKVFFGTGSEKASEEKPVEKPSEEKPVEKPRKRNQVSSPNPSLNLSL
jgi:hypothetical protein